MLLSFAFRLLTEADPRLLLKFAYNFGYKGMRSVERYKKRLARGEHFPPFLFISIINSCQLRCQGCWVDVDAPRKYIDLAAMHAMHDATPIELTPTEFKLLVVLAERSGQVVTREELLLRVWSYADGNGGRLVDVHVGRLRKKLARHGVRDIEIRTARGFGYRLTVAPLREVR